MSGTGSRRLISRRGTDVEAPGLDREGKPALPYAAFAKVGKARIVVMSDAMASAIMGTPEGVRLTGVPRDPANTVFWGKDSAIFTEEVLAWLIAR